MSRVFCCPRRDRRRYSAEYESVGNPFSENSKLLGNSPIGKRPASDDLNLWSNPNDTTHAQSEDDRELLELLEQRDSAASSSVYEMSRGQVERIRTNRRKVQDRWKCVLRELGFEDEDELHKLVTVTPLSQSGSSHFSMKADSLHSAICRDTMIFGSSSSQRNRYATVLSRLLDLDTADDFLTMAKKLYPRIDPDILSDLEWDEHRGLHLSGQHPGQHPGQQSSQNPGQQSSQHPVQHPGKLELSLESSNNN